VYILYAILVTRAVVTSKQIRVAFTVAACSIVAECIPNGIITVTVSNHSSVKAAGDGTATTHWKCIPITFAVSNHSSLKAADDGPATTHCSLVFTATIQSVTAIAGSTGAAHGRW
jgi:hypothetical protein